MPKLLKFKIDILIPGLFIISMLLFFSSTLAQSTIDNSKFVNQSVPERMSPGESYNLVLTFENNGTTSWVPGDYRLRISPLTSSASEWSINEMDLTQRIESGNTASFEVKVTAPSTEGVYPFSAKLIHNNFEFGEQSTPVNITVTKQVNILEGLNSAAFVEQTVPQVMETGKSYKVMISFTNTGKTTWSTGLYRLVMLDASGKAYTGSTWSTYSQSLSESIPPGGSKVFNFDISSMLPGTYTVQWRMASSETGLFGDVTSPAVITVVNPPEIKNEGKSGITK